ncbi:MAG: type IV pilus assembly protein PilM [Verrucomicrobiota bacterium]
MAAPNRIFSLNLGSQTVRLAEFSADGQGGLILRDYQATELMADPATDGSRAGQMAMAVKELVGKMNATGKEIGYSIPSQSVFARFVKLPSVGEEKIDQIVTFEAQQNVPFPIEEVVWDYQLVSSNDAGKLEVVMVAIKSDLLDSVNEAVEGATVRTALVDVAPMALYNAFRYNYSDVSGCSLLIDIGARTTNLLFVESKRVFSRSVPISGNTITAAIAKDFNEPFTFAEERKKRQGFVSLGGTYAEPEDPEVARVSKMIRNTMTRLHAEISRSISFYRSQQGGNQPVRVFLCGGAVAMPYMREFFSEKLALPIEFFNPMRNVAVGNGVDAEKIGKDAHQLGELVGLALRAGNACPMELDLRPPSVTRAREMAARRPYLAMAGTCILLILAGWWLYFQQAATLQAAVNEKLEPRVASLKKTEGEFAAAEKQIKAKQDMAAPLIQAIEDREYWLKLIDDLNTRLPERYIWITSMEALKQPQPVGGMAAPIGGARPEAAPAAPVLVIKGLCLWNDKGGGASAVLDKFVENLSASPFFVIDPKKRTEFNPTRPDQNNENWTFEYKLCLPLSKKGIEL